MLYVPITINRYIAFLTSLRTSPRNIVAFAQSILPNRCSDLYLDYRNIQTPKTHYTTFDCFHHTRNPAMNIYICCPLHILLPQHTHTRLSPHLCKSTHVHTIIAYLNHGARALARTLISAAARIWTQYVHAAALSIYIFHATSLERCSSWLRARAHTNEITKFA